MGVPVGSPVSLSLSLSLFGSAQTLLSGGLVEADNVFTISFPGSGPVFDLPEGFTVNSASGLIVNNEWMGNPLPIPEPTTLVLLGASALAIGGIARRRRRRS